MTRLFCLAAWCCLALPSSCCVQVQALSNALADVKQCMICCENQKDALMVPCGHVSTCMACAQLQMSRHGGECPICRTKITQLVKAYIA